MIKILFCLFVVFFTNCGCINNVKATEYIDTFKQLKELDIDKEKIAKGKKIWEAIKEVWGAISSCKDKLVQFVIKIFNIIFGESGKNGTKIISIYRQI